MHLQHREAERGTLSDLNIIVITDIYIENKNYLMKPLIEGSYPFLKPVPLIQNKKRRPEGRLGLMTSAVMKVGSA